MSIFHDPYASNYRLLSRSYDTTHSIFKASMKTSIITSQESENVGERDDGVARQNSKGMIKLGAKIRSVKDDSKFGSGSKLGTRLDSSMSQIFSQQMKQSLTLNQSTADKYEKEYSPNVKMAYKRIDSTEIASTKTDSPRVSTFLESTNKFISAKLSGGENTKAIESGIKRGTDQTQHNFSKQKLEQVIQQKSAEVNYLTRQLGEEKRNGQTKTRQLQLQIEMLGYTHQQTVSSLNYKLQVMKKQIHVKDSALTDQFKQIKQLKQLRNTQLIEISKIKQDCRKTVEQWKQKYYQLEADLKYLNVKYTFTVQQKNKLESNVRTLSSKLLTTSKLSDQNVRPTASMPRKNSITSISIPHHSHSPHSSRIGDISRKTVSVSKNDDKYKQDQVTVLKRLIQAKNKVIFNLTEDKVKLEENIELLNDLIDENNSERMREKLEIMNENFKYKY